MKQLGLIGFPLDHSWSAGWWNAAFSARGWDDHRYDNFPLEAISDLPKLLAEHPHLIGLNVTIPHKTAVMAYLDEVDATAQAIGAVNTIKIIGKRCIGYNTDAEGFRRSIRPFLDTRHTRALILGTGGASKAVAYTLRQLGIEPLFVSRDASRGNLTYAQLNGAVYNACKLIVNCTPVGLHPTELEPPIDTAHLTPDHFVVDLIYNPPLTPLLQQAQAKGAMILNGADMLRFQAEAAFQLLCE